MDIKLCIAILTALTIIALPFVVFAEVSDLTLPWRGVPGGVQIEIGDYLELYRGTTGFAARYLADPYYYEYYYGVATAAHIADLYEDAYQPKCCYIGYRIGWVYTDGDYYSTKYDIAFIYVSYYFDCNKISPYIATTEGFKFVLAYGDPEIDDYVCKTGVNTSITCGYVIDGPKPYAVEIDENTVVIYHHIFIIDSYSIPADGECDSGGPVWWFYYDPIYHYQGVKLYGTVTAVSKIMPWRLAITGIDAYLESGIEPLTIYDYYCPPPSVAG